MQFTNGVMRTGVNGVMRTSVKISRESNILHIRLQVHCTILYVTVTINSFTQLGSFGFSSVSAISRHRVARAGNCFLHCTNEPSCLAFKFKPTSVDEVNCILSNLTENFGEEGEKGWIYYKDVQVRCIVEYIPQSCNMVCVSAQCCAMEKKNGNACAERTFII
jgi:hypothetical protein